MIRILEGMPENVLGVEATGKVTDEDYERVLIPAVREKLEQIGRLRIVYVLGADFDGWTLGAMWDDAKLGGGHLRDWERVAVVTDEQRVRRLVQAFGWMIPGELRVFGLDELEEAKEWAAA